MSEGMFWAGRRQVRDMHWLVGDMPVTDFQLRTGRRPDRRQLCYKIDVMEFGFYIALYSYSSLLLLSLQRLFNVCIFHCYPYVSVNRGLPGLIQFQHGCKKLWDIVVRSPHSCVELFVDCKKELSFMEFRTLYEIHWSPKGSNYRMQEDDVVFAWEQCLQQCAGIAILISRCD